MNCSCLIPIYNEEDRILKVLDQVIKVEAIDEILCVDDGSTDGSAELIRQHNPNIKIISNPKNLGKTEAVKAGLQQAKGKYILLLDADLGKVNYEEIEYALVKIQVNEHVDMVVLRRINAPLIIKLTRGDILIPGERILKKVDLHKILEGGISKPSGFQLEYAINQYMMINHKIVYWMPSSALNTWPMQKRGFLRGLYEVFSMQINILNYIGLKDFIYQELFFCKKRLI
jgi:glycosyltransferase involved in cell wall biosynthesis